jgi:hypothetical protein
MGEIAKSAYPGHKVIYPQSFGVTMTAAKKTDAVGCSRVFNGLPSNQAVGRQRP